jgi:hypothetical protein
MIQALKGAFMGYIGLLLNAPYKRDRLMWMRCGYFSFFFQDYFLFFGVGVNELPPGKRLFWGF